MRVPIPLLTPEAVAALEGYAFRGNVRELMNIIENALIVSEGAAIQPKHLRFRSLGTDVPTPPVTGIDEANPLPPAVEAMLAEGANIMKNLVDFIREPIMIGSVVIAVLIVIGAYLGSHYYYGDGVEMLEIPDTSALAPSQPRSETQLELDFDGLTTEQSESKETQLESDLAPQEEISVEEFLAELSDEEKQALTEEVADELPRESVFGLGPLPDIPPDYPRQNVWNSLEKSYYDGHANISHELINRVLIKYWNQGKKTASGILSGDTGRVIPLWKDTVYVRWSELELEDGTTERYLGSYLCHGSLGAYEESVENGTQPSWIKIVLEAEAGVDPYSFLDLP